MLVHAGLKNWQSRLVVSDRAHIVFDVMQEVDGLQEQEKAKGGSRYGSYCMRVLRAGRDGRPDVGSS